MEQKEERKEEQKDEPSEEGEKDINGDKQDEEKNEESKGDIDTEEEEILSISEGGSDSLLPSRDDTKTKAELLHGLTQDVLEMETLMAQCGENPLEIPSFVVDPTIHSENTERTMDSSSELSERNTEKKKGIFNFAKKSARKDSPKTARKEEKKEEEKKTN